MTQSKKERTRRLCYAMLDRKACDADCHEYNLTPSDLDELYSLSENIVDKALNKKEFPPSTIALAKKEVDSWVEFYFSEI
jgi:arsenate reductase-like glutaredoxin family protein